mgnify:CR=1 FL=1
MKITNVSAIVRASEEQSVGLNEINQAVNTIDQGTQQNAAMVEESTAAAHSLSSEAASLFALVEKFKLQDETATQGRLAAYSGPRAA